MAQDRNIIDEIVGIESESASMPESLLPVEEKSGFHQIAAAGCYTMGLILGCVAVWAMWRIQFLPSEYMIKFLGFIITSIVAVVFLWLLLIKKW